MHCFAGYFASAKSNHRFSLQAISFFPMIVDLATTDDVAAMQGPENDLYDAAYSGDDSAVSQLLADRENIWQQEQEAVADGLKRIATVFSGNQTLTKLPKNGELTQGGHKALEQFGKISE